MLSISSHLLGIDAWIPQIADTVTQIERLFGKPIDVEWCVDEKQLWILQARPITSISHLITSTSLKNGLIFANDHTKEGETKKKTFFPPFFLNKSKLWAVF
jgi:phosphoenolpyruvate synthase/pyruvate phosphate dikinase